MTNNNTILGNIIIEDNKMPINGEAQKNATNMMSAINVYGDQIQLNVGNGAIILRNNVAVDETDKTHMFNLAVRNKLDRIPVFKQIEGTKFNARQSVMSVAFDNPYIGLVIASWSDATVDGYSEDAFKKVFTADKFGLNNVRRELSVLMNGNSVEISKPHIHKICGTATDSVCVHDGIAAHSENILFNRLTKEYVERSGFPTEGNYFLDEDITLTSRVTVTATLSICLNGHTISGLALTASARK